MQPGKWDTAVGGHISFGETVDQGLQRETAEELGITGFSSRPITSYIWETAIESELVFLFIARYDKPIHTNPDEIEEGKYWTKEEIEAHIDDGIFTPNFIKEFDIIKKENFLTTHGRERL